MTSPAHWLSPSGWALAEECLYWANGDLYHDRGAPGGAALVGTCVHSMAEAYTKGMIGFGEFESINFDGIFSKYAPEVVAVAKPIFESLKGWLKKSYKWTHCETGFLYDAETDTSKEWVRRGMDGYHDHGPMQVPGTIDLLALDGTTAIIFDIKTGKKQNSHESQLKIQAIGMARLLGVTTCKVGFVYPRKTKVDQVDIGLYMTFELDKIAAEVKATLARVPISTPTPGLHCWRCPLGKAACPAFAQQEPVL